MPAYRGPGASGSTAAKKRVEAAAAKKRADEEEAEKMAAEKAKLMEAYRDRQKVRDPHVKLYLGTSRRIDPDGKTGDFARMRDWCNSVMQGYQVRDIGQDWKNGCAMLAMFNGFKEGVEEDVSMGSVDPSRSRQNLEQALTLFTEHYQVVQFVDVDTILSVDGNELEQCMYVYLSELERVWNEAQAAVPVQVDLIKDMEGALNASYETERARSDTLDSIDHATMQSDAADAQPDPEPARSRSPTGRGRNSRALADIGHRASEKKPSLSRKERMEQERKLAEERAAKIDAAERKPVSKPPPAVPKIQFQGKLKDFSPSQNSGAPPKPSYGVPAGFFDATGGEGDQEGADEPSDHSSDDDNHGNAGQSVGFLATVIQMAARRRNLRESSRGAGRTFVSDNLYNSSETSQEAAQREAQKEALRQEARRKQTEEQEAARAKAYQDELARHEADNAAKLDSFREKQEELEELEAEKKRILKLYKFHSYLAMKNHLKSHEVPTKEVDGCTGKYEVVKLAEKHNVDIPDDPKALKRTRRPSPTRLKINEAPPLPPPPPSSRK